jgi:FkbM family methyltransferase
MLKQLVPLQWRLRLREAQAQLTRRDLPREAAATAARRAYLNWLRQHPEEPIVFDVEGSRMRLDPQDRTISEAIFLYGTWEPFEIELVRRIVRPEQTFLDIGAHIGYYSLAAARAMGCRGRVFSFEPSPVNFALLQENVRMNGLEDVVQPVHAALFREPSEIELYLAEHNSGDNRIYPSTPEEDTYVNGHLSGARRVVKVPALKGDDFLTKQGVEKVDVIKLDVQGAEMDVLDGLTRTLESPEVVIFTEFWPYGLRRSGADPDDWLELMSKRLGFRMFHIQADERRVTPIEPEQFARDKGDADPREQIDLICCRSEELLREHGVLA